MTGMEVALLAASTAISAGASIMGGMAASNAAKLEAAQAEEAARTRRLQGEQEANQIREEADSIRRRNIAIRAASGLDTSSGSFQAIQTEVANNAKNDARNAKINALSEANRFDLQAQQSRIEGKSAKIGGFVRAGGTLLSGGRDYYKTRSNRNKGTG